MIVKPLNAEATISGPTTVANAVVVRLYATAAGVVTNIATGGSFSMPTGSIVFLEKSPADTINATGTIEAVSVAYTIS
jgi:hypothetical protein